MPGGGFSFGPAIRDLRDIPFLTPPLEAGFADLVKLSLTVDRSVKP